MDRIIRKILDSIGNDSENDFFDYLVMIIFDSVSDITKIQIENYFPKEKLVEMLDILQFLTNKLRNKIKREINLQHLAKINKQVNESRSQEEMMIIIGNMIREGRISNF